MSGFAVAAGDPVPSGPPAPHLRVVGEEPSSSTEDAVVVPIASHRPAHDESAGANVIFAW